MKDINSTDQELNREWYERFHKRLVVCAAVSGDDAFRTMLQAPFAVAVHLSAAKFKDWWDWSLHNLCVTHLSVNAHSWLQNVGGHENN